MNYHELYNSKVLNNFKFEEDFYYDLAMKYKPEIESNEFFKDLSYMPKGCLLLLHMLSCINVQQIADEVMKKKFKIYLYETK